MYEEASKKRNKLNKYGKKVFFIVFIFLVLIFMLSSPRELPDYCQKIESGWSCDLRNRNNGNSFYKEEIKIKEICKRKGLVSYCDGPCDVVYCSIPFDDAGKECTNSSQCKGHCITKRSYNEIMDILESRYKVTGFLFPGFSVKCDDDDEGCKGICSEIPPLSCNWYFDIEDGYYVFHGGGWCY